MQQMQSRIADLLGRIAPPDFLFSPVKGRSYVDNAAHHIGANAFWMLDVADYFPNCTANKVARFFRQDLECSPDVTAILVRLTTWNEALPQGSPCSPILAYFAHHQMWNEINTLTGKSGCKFSLYADDLTISGSLVRKELIWQIKQIVHRHGLLLKASKEVSLINRPADITGVIVRDGRTMLPNRQKKKLLEIRKQHRCTSNLEDRKRLESQIAGRVAQQHQVEQIDPSASKDA